MRRLAACLILSLALAVPAAAQPGRITVVAPVSNAGLRGPISAAPAPVAEEAPLLFPPVQATAIASSPVGGSQCRTTCSRQYYFCLAGDDGTCPQRWVRCVAGCGS